MIKGQIKEGWKLLRCCNFPFENCAVVLGQHGREFRKKIIEQVVLMHVVGHQCDLDFRPL